MNHIIIMKLTTTKFFSSPVPTSCPSAVPHVSGAAALLAPGAAEALPGRAIVWGRSHGDGEETYGRTIHRILGY